MNAAGGGGVEDRSIKGHTVKESEVLFERGSSATFRSRWVLRQCLLTDYGLYVFELPNTRVKKQGEHGTLVSLIPIESMNGVQLRSEGKKKFSVNIATFLQDQKFLCNKEEEADDWRRLLHQAIIARRKRAALQGTMRKDGAAEQTSSDNNLEILRAQRLKDIDSLMNNEINAIMQLYLSRRTEVLDEMMGREVWAIRELAQKKREAIELILKARSAAIEAEAPN